jgi:hypothetical protein
MADPVTMAAIGTYAQTAATAATAAIGAYTTVASADAAKKKAEAEGAWAQRRADEERAAGQRQASEDKRKADILQSRLGAVAGASGSGASDPTVMNIWGDIERQGDVNAGVAQASSQSKADAISYQSALDRWSADSNAKMAKIGAAGTLIGGLGSAYSKYSDGMSRLPSRMSARYGGWQTTVRTGYGR